MLGLDGRRRGALVAGAAGGVGGRGDERGDLAGSREQAAGRVEAREGEAHGLPSADEECEEMERRRSREGEGVERTVRAGRADPKLRQQTRSTRTREYTTPLALGRAHPQLTALRDHRRGCIR